MSEQIKKTASFLQDRVRTQGGKQEDRQGGEQDGSDKTVRRLRGLHSSPPRAEASDCCRPWATKSGGEKSDGTIENAPEIGIILGTGLGGLANAIENQTIFEYKDIPGFPVSTVEGHKGRLIFGTLGGKKVVAMQGRFHFYEGWTPQQVVFPVRVMWAMGVHTVFVSNAAGGVNPDFRTGDIMVIDDHINLIPNPLVGPNDASIGPRFPDMHGCYDPELRKLADTIAAQEGIRIRHGVYVGGTGPTFETQAEYKYFRAIGGDAAGMSTTPEVIAARHAGMRVFGASVITNVGLSDEADDHEDVQKQGAAAGKKMTTLFTKIIEKI